MLNIFKCYLNIYKYLQRVLASPDMDVAAGRVVGSSEMGTVRLENWILGTFCSREVGCETTLFKGHDGLVGRREACLSLTAVGMTPACL